MSLELTNDMHATVVTDAHTDAAALDQDRDAISSPHEMPDEYTRDCERLPAASAESAVRETDPASDRLLHHLVVGRGRVGVFRVALDALIKVCGVSTPSRPRRTLLELRKVSARDASAWRRTLMLFLSDH